MQSIRIDVTRRQDNQYRHLVSLLSYYQLVLGNVQHTATGIIAPVWAFDADVIGLADTVTLDKGLIECALPAVVNEGPAHIIVRSATRTMFEMVLRPFSLSQYFDLASTMPTSCACGR